MFFNLSKLVYFRTAVVKVDLFDIFSINSRDQGYDFDSGDA